MKKILLFLLFAQCLSPSIAQGVDDILCYPKDPKARYREHNVDMIKGIINVQFEPNEGKVKGKVIYTFKPKQQYIDSLYLDGPGLIIKNITLDGKEVSHVKYDDGFSIRFGKTLIWETEHQLVITYSCVPRKGIYFVGWNDEKNLMRKQVWTQGQGVDNRYWIPGYDDVSDKLLTETLITFDKAYEVVSNGKLVDKKDNNDGTLTWHYAMEHPQVLYLVMIGIDKYAFKDYTSSGGLRIRQYYYPDRPETVESTYQYGKEMMDWEEKELGVPFPWGTYANVPVQEFLYGAMENTTATIFTDYYVVDERSAIDRNYIGVNCHEQTHQWFGDYVTEISATHHWLHESFATHYAKHFRRFVYGEDEFQKQRRDEMNSALGEDAMNSLPIAHSQAGSPRHYPKGSLVLDMLRYVLGNEQYRKCITVYLKNHPYQNVESNDLYRTIYETLGVNLDWFFDEWVYRGAYPKYEVKYMDLVDSFEMEIKQVQTLSNVVGYFKMPVNIDCYYADGSIDHFKTINDGAEQLIRFPKSAAGKKISFVLFDPNNNVYKRVEFKKSYEELIAQAANAQNMIDRYDAVLALKSFSLDKKRKDLAALFRKEPFYNVRSEIISQLVYDTDKGSLQTLKLALSDSNHMVRRAALEPADSISPRLLKDYEKLLSDRSYVNIEIALNKLCKQFPKNAPRYLEMTKNIMGMTKNVRIAWLQNSFAVFGDKYIPELVDYTSHSYEFRTRTKAFGAIEAISYSNDALLFNLIEAMVNVNGRLAGPASGTLKKLCAKADVRANAIRVCKAHNWKDYEKEILDKSGIF